MDEKPIRVKLVGSHPHRGEYGTLMGEKVADMYLVNLEHCDMGIAACYAAPANFRVVTETLHRVKP
jgi:hypothetical protein